MSDSKLRNIIQYATLTLTNEDSGDNQIAQCSSMDKIQNCNVVYPYGISANAPKNSTILKFNVGASAQNPAGIPTNSQNRFKGLKDWEIAVGNFLKKSKIFFDEEGNIEIDTSEFDKSVTIKNSKGSIEIDDNGSITGTNLGGFFKLDESGQFNVNNNFTVDP